MTDPGTRNDIRLLWQIVEQLLERLELTEVYTDAVTVRLITKAEMRRIAAATENL